jgi:RNA polymerase sigma-70 factor (ECF subfamily)
LKDTWDFERDPLSRLRKGDSAPFEAFVSRETNTFLAFYRRLGASASESEDLVQEVFLKLFRHAETYQASGRFSAFAFRIARNAWIDHRRRSAASPLESARQSKASDEAQAARDDALGQFPGREEEPGVVLGRNEEAGRMRAALAKLSEPHKLVFELGVLQELPYGEISEILDVPVGTVKSRMFHAVRKLRAALGEDSDES